MHKFKSDHIIFVGNSTGYIRAFSMTSQLEKRPLYDKRVVKEVVSVDVSRDGRYLLAAHRKGKLVLWDLTKYSRAH